MILSVKTELMKIKTEKTEFGKKQNGIWKKIKRISYGPTYTENLLDGYKILLPTLSLLINLGTG